MKKPEPSVALEIDNLTVRYPGSGENALDRICMRISGGEVVALAGPNGCGKTTLLRAAGGMLEPRAGSVLIAGTPGPVHRLSPELRARRIGVVPQMEKLPPGFTATETVMLGRISFHGWFGRESDSDRAAVQSALAAVGLEGAEGRRVETLSGGAQQRVMIARALAQEAPILLMDEPTAHLDIRYQIETLTLLRTLARTLHRAVLIAMHDLNLVARFSDRVALLDRGSMIRCGFPKDVLTSESLSTLYGIPLQVIPHPQRGFPLVLPDGDGAAETAPKKSEKISAGSRAKRNLHRPGYRG
jgi:iron complex transport system ATP-binding protein